MQFCCMTQSGFVLTVNSEELDFIESWAQDVLALYITISRKFDCHIEFHWKKKLQYWLCVLERWTHHHIHLECVVGELAKKLFLVCVCRINLKWLLVSVKIISRDYQLAVRLIMQVAWLSSGFFLPMLLLIYITYILVLLLRSFFLFYFPLHHLSSFF